MTTKLQVHATTSVLARPGPMLTNFNDQKTGLYGT